MKRVAVWALIVVPIWIAMILCTHWEPVQRDGWGHYLFHKNVHLSLKSLYDFAKGTYVHNNPRLGQVLTMLVFTPGPWHTIVTPIVELGMFYLLTALVVGRWPRRTEDALLFLLIVAMVSITAPQFGLMLFYRPYTGNYLFGLVINLVFLIPYRFEYEASTKRGWWWIPIMLVLGFASGMSNEHTGPAIVAAAGVATFMCWRRDRKIPWWAIAGVIAMIAGGIALFKAPGQAIRYRGLASQDSMLGRIIHRGLLGDLKVVGTLFALLLPTAAWGILAAIARVVRRPDEVTPQRRWAELAIAATSIAIVLTLLASPKDGPRLFLGSVALGCAAIAGVVVRQLASRWSRWVAAGMASIVVIFVGVECISAYHEVGPEFAARIDALNHAPMNSVLDLPSYTVKRTRWVLDDDLLIKQIRDSVSYSFGLALIKIDGVGVSDVTVPEDP